MKHLYAIVAVLSVFAGFAQQQETIAPIAEAERKAAARIINFAANPNTSNYDVTYHKLQLTVNPAQQFISGVITTTYTAKAPMSTLTFDLNQQLTVSSVTRNGANLTFTQNSNDELVITLPGVQNAGVSDTVVVTYSGVPSDDQDAFATGTHSGTPVLWTLSEPYGAKDWWPCKQDLSDKVNSIDVYITAPSQYTAVSNGLQVSATTSGTSKTTHFHHNYPIPAYLIAIAVTNYTIINQTAGTAPNTFPVVNYIYPESAAGVTPQLAQTLPIMNLYESLFEPYPFRTEKYGHAQCGFGGGMEHTTVSFMGGFNRELIAHELGHQWFGDKVTCGSWKDIWLNEGFATYLSGLVVEHLDGAAAFVSWKNSLISNITSQSGGALYLTDADTTSVDRIFSSRLSYNKGAMVVHMLRWKLGDANFYQGVKNYLADPWLAYAYAKTPDLQAHLEAASGQDLDEFFNDWVYHQGYPSYTAIVQNISPGQARITLNQSQSHPSVSFFEMPVPVRLSGAGGQTFDTVLNHTVNGQQFTVQAPFTVTGVSIDPDRHIISRNNTVTLSNTEFAAATAIRLYPNPVSGILKADMPQGTIIKRATFYNALGQKVLESTHATQWNVAPLARGVHFIMLETGEGTMQLKFIRE